MGYTDDPAGDGRGEGRMDSNARMGGRSGFVLGALVAISACGNVGKEASVPPEVTGSTTMPAAEVAPQPKPYGGPVAFSVVAEGLTASFTDESEGTVLNRTWDFGDGATSVAAAPIHAYSRVGVYEVRETIADGEGKTFDRTLPVRVMPFPPELRNGTARPGLSAVATYELHYFARPPLGASHLDIELTGPAELAELYVKFGSVPTDSSYDCHVALTDGAARCTFDAPRAGPYYARILATKNFADASLKASWNETVAEAGDKKSGASSAAQNH
ncbi:PKD domain-containing protein [Luteibacter sp.]|uniref:PKD domain-containing protein n=1 Tax=Luteibacter sp. TaxID=1886636 RepID=UPI0028090E78|nr:PKD domain-containing protein [Luteibacter sp.]MDQ8049655.1 PKD domain-containing protein [Luteibacter sp.]